MFWHFVQIMKIPPFAVNCCAGRVDVFLRINWLGNNSAVFGDVMGGPRTRSDSDIGDAYNLSTFLSVCLSVFLSLCLSVFFQFALLSAGAADDLDYFEGSASDL